MARDDLDRILGEEHEIIPSIGFVHAVMEAVQRQAEAPPAIPFPWKRALPGMAGAALALGWVLLVGARVWAGSAAAPPEPVVMPPALAALLETARMMGAGWIALALILSLVSVKFSSRLAA